MNQFGSKSCIRNLKQELHILQACSNFFTHRIASNNCYSWKFPKTLAVDVKLEDILLKIVHDKNNLKRNQIYHLLLLELIIDRLLLLIHTTSLWMLGCMNFREQCITIGNKLSVEAQCNQLTSIVEEFENLINEQSEWPANVGPLSETDNLQLAIYGKDTEAEITHQTFAWLQTIEDEYTKKIENVSTHKPQFEQKLFCKKSIQTDPIKFESSEISSHSEDLRNLLESVFTCFVHLCSFCNLPSEIGSKLNELDNAPFDAAWIAETQRVGSAVRKDFERLSTYVKHLRERVSQEERRVEELRTELDSSAKELAKKETELESTKMAHLEQIEHLSREKKEIEETVAGLKNELGQHHLRGKKLEETVHELRQKLCECETDTNSLTKVLQEKTALIRGQNAEFLTLESTIRELQKQLSEAQARHTDALEENQRALLEKNNMEIQLSNMRHKHQLVSERIEVLTDQNSKQESKEKEYLALIGELQEKLTAAEASKAKILEEYQQQEIMLSEFQETSKQACTKTVKLEEEIDELQSTILRYQNKIELLIQYPDLNIPTQTTKDAPIQSVQDEIEGQINANELRIAVLQEQTKRLQNARKRMSEVRKQHSIEEPASAASDVTFSSIDYESFLERNVLDSTRKPRSFTPPEPRRRVYRAHKTIKRLPPLSVTLSGCGSAISHKSSLPKEHRDALLALSPFAAQKLRQPPRVQVPPLQLWSGPVKTQKPSRRRQY